MSGFILNKNQLIPGNTYTLLTVNGSIIPLIDFLFISRSEKRLMIHGSFLKLHKISLAKTAYDDSEFGDGIVLGLDKRQRFYQCTYDPKTIIKAKKMYSIKNIN